MPHVTEPGDLVRMHELVDGPVGAELPERVEERGADARVRGETNYGTVPVW